MAVYGARARKAVFTIARELFDPRSTYLQVSKCLLYDRKPQEKTFLQSLLRPLTTRSYLSNRQQGAPGVEKYTSGRKNGFSRSRSVLCHTFRPFFDAI